MAKQLTLKNVADKFVLKLKELAERQAALAEVKLQISSQYEMQLSNAKHIAAAITQLAEKVGWNAEVEVLTGDWRRLEDYYNSNSTYPVNKEDFRRLIAAKKFSEETIESDKYYVPLSLHFEDGSQSAFVLLDREYHVKRWSGNRGNYKTQGSFFAVCIEKYLLPEPLPEMNLYIENNHLVAFSKSALIAAENTLKQLIAAD